MKLPPVVPLSMILTTWQVSSSEAPWFLLRWARKVGSVFCVRLPFPGHFVIVGDAALAREIFNDPLTTKPYILYRPIDIALGCSNMFTDNGERWKHARKAISPAFSSAHVNRMNQVCKEKLEDWIQRRLTVFCEKNQDFDPAREMLGLTLAIISEAAFHYTMEEEEAEFFARNLR
jgi:cytochrome P450